MLRTWHSRHIIVAMKMAGLESTVKLLNHLANNLIASLQDGCWQIDASTRDEVVKLLSSTLAADGFRKLPKACISEDGEYYMPADEEEEIYNGELETEGWADRVE